MTERHFVEVKKLTNVISNEISQCQSQYIYIYIYISRVILTYVRQYSIHRSRAMYILWDLNPLMSGQPRNRSVGMNW